MGPKCQRFDFLGIFKNYEDRGNQFKQAVKNLLMTNKFEKPFQHSFGADLTGLLFELADDESNVLIADQVAFALENFEPRAKLISVSPNVQPDRNTARVQIVFRIINTSEEVTFETTITRLR